MNACVGCGRPTRKKRCHECRGEHMRYENEMRRVANIVKRRLINERGKVCDVCGAVVESIALHHIQRIADGGTNDPENLQLVCHVCHDEIHREDRVNDNKRR